MLYTQVWYNALSPLTTDDLVRVESMTDKAMTTTGQQSQQAGEMERGGRGGNSAVLKLRRGALQWLFNR